MPSRTFVVRVNGRPAPQGSKKLGAHGQLLEQSAYLPAWRGEWEGRGASRRYRHGAVGRAVYQEYAARRVSPGALPLFGEPVTVVITFYVDSDPDGPPDLDKLARSTFDALTVCRMWDDDARVRLAFLRKVPADYDNPAGALIMVKPYSITPVALEMARRRKRLLERRWK